MTINAVYGEVAEPPTPLELKLDDVYPGATVKATFELPGEEDLHPDQRRYEIVGVAYRAHTGSLKVGNNVLRYASRGTGIDLLSIKILREARR